MPGTISWFEVRGRVAGDLAGGDGRSPFYVDVPSVGSSIEQALARGGKLLMPATRLPGTTIAVIADPEGHPIGLSGPA